MLALRLMFSDTYYAQTYAGIIGLGLLSSPYLLSIATYVPIVCTVSPKLHENEDQLHTVTLAIALCMDSAQEYKI